MPYKDPERKRQWEQAHRELRNKQRRAQRLAVHTTTPVCSELDPNEKKPHSAWSVIRVAAGVGIFLLITIAGVRIPSHLSNHLE